MVGLHGRLIEGLYPDLQVVSRCIPDQPKGIYDDESENGAIPKIVELGKRMATEDEIEALIVSCAADPGVSELRAILDLPVIGAGSSAAAAALCFSDRIGTLGITEETPARMKRALGAFLVGEARPEGIRTTLDLMEESGKERAVKACIQLVQNSGARIVALACTGMATIGIARELEKASGVMVVDPVAASGWAVRFFTERKK